MLGSVSKQALDAVAGVLNERDSDSSFDSSSRGSTSLGCCPITLGALIGRELAILRTMGQLQFAAVVPPLDTPGVGTLAARILSYAAIMDLLDALPVMTLDQNALVEGAQRVSAATGVGATTIVKLHERGSEEPRRLRELLGEFYEQLEESSAPALEWRPVNRVLGSALLMDLLGISASSLERYESSERKTPDEIADRLHFLALRLSDLAGAYNQFGVRRWFDRPRTLLRGQTPRQVLGEGWTSDSEPARTIRNLTSALTSSPVT